MLGTSSRLGCAAWVFRRFHAGAGVLGSVVLPRVPVVVDQSACAPRERASLLTIRAPGCGAVTDAMTWDLVSVADIRNQDIDKQGSEIRKLTSSGSGLHPFWRLLAEL